MMSRTHWPACAAARCYLACWLSRLRTNQGPACGCILDEALRSPPRARRSPVEWETPNGQIAHVNLELRFSAFHGYGGPEAEAGYLGLQCHGVLWPSPEAELPHYWPIAPPIVSGKARSWGH